jgi:elongation factor P
MINVNNFKPGMTFQIKEGIFSVISSSHSKQGRGQASVKVKIKNLRTGSVIYKT